MLGILYTHRRDASTQSRFSLGAVPASWGCAPAKRTASCWVPLGFSIPKAGSHESLGTRWESLGRRGWEFVMTGDILTKTNKQVIPDSLEILSAVFCLPIDRLSIIFSQSSYRINFWQYNWTEAGGHCLQDQPRKLRTWSEAVNILLVFQCVYSEGLSYGVERVLGHTGTRISVGKISGPDKGWGSALRRAMKERSDFVLRFPPKGGEFDYNNGVFRGVLGRQERDFLNINVPGS